MSVFFVVVVAVFGFSLIQFMIIIISNSEYQLSFIALKRDTLNEMVDVITADSMDYVSNLSTCVIYK